jgi:hypothetical protein
MEEEQSLMKHSSENIPPGDVFAAFLVKKRSEFW